MEGSPVVGTPANKSRARAPRPKKSKVAPPAGQTAPSPTTSAQSQTQGAIVSQLQSSLPSFTAPYSTLQQSTMISPGGKMSQPAHTATQLVSRRQLASVPHTTSGSQLVTLPQSVNRNQLVTLQQLTNNNPALTLSSAGSSDGITIMVTQPMCQLPSAAGLVPVSVTTQPQLVMQGVTSALNGHLTTVASTQGLGSVLTSVLSAQSPTAVVTHVPTSPPSGTEQVSPTSGTLYSNSIVPKASSPLCSTQVGSSLHNSAPSYSVSQLSHAPVFQSAPQTSVTSGEVPAGSKAAANQHRRQHSTAQVSIFVLVFSL